MPTNANSYIFKYKLADGTWVTIPVLAGDVYTAYREYCFTNQLDPVTEKTYYETLGNLQELVTQLSSNSSNMAAIAKALGGGVLPNEMGGLGVRIGTGTEFEYKTLQEALVALCGVALSKNVDAKVQQINTTVGQKLDASKIAVGPDDPNKVPPPAAAEFYFQFKE